MFVIIHTTVSLLDLSLGNNNWIITRRLLIISYSTLYPQMIGPLLKAINSATNNSYPIHLHTHDTSGGQIATLLEFARCGG